MKITLVNSCSPELASSLICYIGGEMTNPGQMVHRAIPARPNCFVQIILEGGYVLYDRKTGEKLEPPQAGLFGPLTRYRYDLEAQGRLKTLTAQLQPAAAARLFNLDLVSLVDGFVPIKAPGDLLEALQSAPDWRSMAEIADHWLQSLTGGQVCSDPVARQARRLRSKHGMVPIQELADAAGLSLRHFQRRFRQLTGLNPKHYARICRIGYAVHRKELEPDLSWTALALDAGYADQSHFIRDFKALTGTVPGEFLRGQRLVLHYPALNG